MQLPSPAQIKEEYPLTVKDSIASWRKTAGDILKRDDPRLAAIIGPCSVHDEDSTYDYALRLKQLSHEIDHIFFPIMRIFIEKPRSNLGWKGMLYDPHLNGSHDIAAGIRKSRSLILKIAELGVPCATELLEPLIVPYLDDLIVWGLIGARTSASQPHRQLASGLDFPIGFKNDCHGDIEIAVSAILTARASHSRIGINATGQISSIQTKGNPLSHLVLRGSKNTPNYDPQSIQIALKALEERNLEKRIVVDCSHGNCGKDHLRQKKVFESVVEQAKNNKSIAGLMLESHLFSGKQLLGNDPGHLLYGVSITDPCLGWEDTETLLRSTSINWVQK